MKARLFTDHPHAVGETYLEHARAAAGFGFALLGAGAACLVHAFIPALFTHTGSATIRRLHEALGRRRAPAHFHADVQDRSGNHPGQLIYEI